MQVFCSHKHVLLQKLVQHGSNLTSLCTEIAESLLLLLQLLGYKLSFCKEIMKKNYVDKCYLLITSLN